MMAENCGPCGRHGQASAIGAVKAGYSHRPATQLSARGHDWRDAARSALHKRHPATYKHIVSGRRPAAADVSLSLAKSQRRRRGW